MNRRLYLRCRANVQAEEFVKRQFERFNPQWVLFYQEQMKFRAKELREKRKNASALNS